MRLSERAADALSQGYTIEAGDEHSRYATIGDYLVHTRIAGSRDDALDVADEIAARFRADADGIFVDPVLGNDEIYDIVIDIPWAGDVCQELEEAGVNLIGLSSDGLGL